MRRSDHRREISAKLAGSGNIQSQQVEQVVAQPPAFVELDRRNPQSLLPDFGRGGVVTAMGGAAHVALMRGEDGPEQPPLAIEDRHERGQIRQMAAAVIGIVEKNDVALPYILESFLDGTRRPWQRTDMNRDVLRLRN